VLLAPISSSIVFHMFIVYYNLRSGLDLAVSGLNPRLETDELLMALNVFFDHNTKVLHIMDSFLQWNCLQCFVNRFSECPADGFLPESIYRRIFR